MFSSLTVASHVGPYAVEFMDRPFVGLEERDIVNSHCIVDARVARLYRDELVGLLGNAKSTLEIEATETAKNLLSFTHYIEHLVESKVRRGDRLVAVGGGIIQDITCFLAATLLRGLDWYFYPTTLLAQADSCIGSKSSINVGKYKNLLGTYTPPRRVFISPTVLKTLDVHDRRSGIGEMLKVHIIDGPASFQKIAADYDRLFSDDDCLATYIRRSLEIKKGIVEEDEFDRGLRNIMNYGHSFGHAIEAATDFRVPHGIAVTMGMDLANFLSFRTGGIPSMVYSSMHAILKKNYHGFEATPIPIEEFFDALGKDKKNVGSRLRLILPDELAKVRAVELEATPEFRDLCIIFLRSMRAAT